MRPQPRMQNKKAYEHSHHGHTGDTRHAPLNVFNGFLLSLPGDRALLPPSFCVYRKLDASVGASEPHDFAVRLTCCSSKAPSASIASRPAFVTIASRPSLGRDGAGYSFDLGETTKAIFLQMGLDRANHIDPPGQFTLCTTPVPRPAAA